MGFIMTSFMGSLIRILFGLKKLTEYEYEYYLAWKNHPNTNTNTSIIFKYRIICSPLPVMRFIMTSFMGSLIRMLFGLKKKVDRIQIRILFGLKILTEYEYEYYSVWKYRPNTNTNIILLEKITRIRIRILVFGLNYSNNIRIPKYSLISGLAQFGSWLNNTMRTWKKLCLQFISLSAFFINNCTVLQYFSVYQY